jgi:uncharacterized protein YutE (UPF0331/DUF86 family)
MPDRDVVLAKVDIIQRYLRRIRETTGLDPNSLDNIDKQDIFVLNLQRAVQAAIDLAAHIVASEGIGLPEAIKDNFSLLRNAGIIGDSLTSRMESMSGFRNIAIHDYQAMNIDILKSILSKHLKDLEDFYTTVLIYFKFVSQ